MAEPASATSPELAGGSLRSRYRFLRRFAHLALAYWTAEERWKASALTVALLLLTLMQVGLAIWTNYWNGALFDALGERSVPKFLTQIGIFAIIFILTMCVTAIHLQVKRTLQVSWRQWLTARVVDRWMAEKRHYHLIFTPGEHDNPDGRIAEDVHIVTENAISLAHTLVYSIFILGSFIDILLSVAGSTTFSVLGSSFYIPGYMVLLAFLYAGVGTGMGLVLGQPLVRSTNGLQTTEANFRFALARARENSESIGLLGGERMERLRSSRLFADIRRWWSRQTLALTWILFFTSGYGALLPVFPILVMAPQYIAGTMTLGVLMQSAQAFQRLTSALSWPIDNLADMARWRASAERVLSLHDDLQKLDEARAKLDENRIAVGKAVGETLIVRDLRIARPDGQVVLDGLNLQVRTGERLLIDGDAGAAIDLFKVVAGLWPWGRGEVLLPAASSIFFMPRNPFIPHGTLEEALSYPDTAGTFSRDDLHDALESSGLGYLVTRLDEVDAWDRSLTVRGQQRLSFARLFLRRPSWIFMQEATDAFDAKSETKIMEAVLSCLPGVTLITIGFHAALEPFHQRKLCLERAADGRYLFGGPPAPKLPELSEIDETYSG